MAKVDDNFVRRMMEGNTLHVSEEELRKGLEAAEDINGLIKWIMDNPEQYKEYLKTMGEDFPAYLKIRENEQLQASRVCVEAKTPFEMIEQAATALEATPEVVIAAKGHVLAETAMRIINQARTEKNRTGPASSGVVRT